MPSWECSVRDGYQIHLMLIGSKLEFEAYWSLAAPTITNLLMHSSSTLIIRQRSKCEKRFSFSLSS